MTTTIETATQKVSLDETGTRYDHYMELKETFMLGIEVINNMRPAYRSTGDELVKGKLEIAVEMIDKRLSYLAGLSIAEHSGSDLDRELYKIEAERQARKKLLTGGSNGPNDKIHSEVDPST